MLWNGNPPATSDKALGVLASKLRGILNPDGVRETSKLTGAFGCYRLELPQGSWVDVVAAEEATDEAEAALTQGDLKRARRSAALAESLSQGRFLPGEDGTWVEERRREFAAVRARALSALAEACLRSSEPQESVRWAELAIEAEPFRESGYRRLMEAHIAAGDRAEALRVYERCRVLLAEELGAYPSPETEAVYRGLLDATTAPAASPPKPELVADRSSPRGPRRRRIAAVTGLLLAMSVAAVAFAIESPTAAPLKVVPNSLIRIDPHTLRVTQVVPLVDSQPDLVVDSGGFLWVTSHVLRDVNSSALRNTGDRTLTRIDPFTRQVKVVGGLEPCGLTADPSGDVWVANCYPPGAGLRDNVTLVAAKTLAFVKTFPSIPGGKGFYRGMTYGGGSLWVSQIFGGSNPNTVTQLNPQSRTGSPRTFALDLSAAGLAWADDYDDLWLANFFDGTLTRMHPPSRAPEIVDTPLASPGFPLVHGDVVWAADWGSPVLVYLHAVGPPKPQEIVLPTRNRAAGVWNIAAGAGAIWATTPRDGTLWRIDPKTDKVTRIPVPYLPTGVAADANNVWVTVRGR
jgi:SARP family transcriptional regulator, regulator of embCAB operon